MLTIDKCNALFYFVLLLGLTVLLYTHPFLRYPYDMIHHLIVMDDIYMQLIDPMQKHVGIWINDIYIMIPTEKYESLVLDRPRYLWHYMWAEVFACLNIDSTQMILRAKIIHIVQTMISFASIYYFSHVVLRNVFKDMPTTQLRWLSLWSVLIWLSIFATFSGLYHQVWIMWYSVNYQITLPLFWYMLGLTLVLLLEKTSWKIKLFFALQILLLTRFMIQVHSMEFLYYLMHISVFSLVFIDKVYLLIKKYFYIVIPIILAIIYMTKYYQPEKSLVFKYLSIEKLPALYEYIMQAGAFLLSGYNRASASVNELMYFILYLGIVFVTYLLWEKYKKREIKIQFRVLLFIILTSAFVLIPLDQFSGGLFSVITSMPVVNRLYYSSSLFVLIPIFTYYIFQKYKPRYIHLLIALSLVSVTIFSKYNNVLNHNYYKNIQSIKYSFDERKIGFNLSQTQISIIKEELDTYEKNNMSHKEIRYYARADIAFVIKYFFHKNVYWKGRSVNPDHKKIYEENKNNKDYHQILFEIPQSFPRYRPYS